MKRSAVILLVLAVICMLPDSVLALEPWPAESHTNAVRLTDLDSGLDTVNWSGAFWNPNTRTLWLACNSGYFWALVESGSNGFQVATNAAGIEAKWSPGGDLEAICQADGDTNLVYLMDENGWIREYNVANYGVVAENRNWDVRAICPEAGGTSGGEGLAFVPDDYLHRQNFRDSNGAPCVSTNGMGGLMFIGYQADGYVYAFDLNRTLNTFGFVGRYQTGRAETADLEFERATGRLFIWHNPANINYLEIAELGSVVDGTNRRLRQLAEYAGPRDGNLEGFAIVPNSATNTAGGCIVTDDDNTDREAVMWYRQFQPAADADADGLTDGWELWHFGTVTQTTGTADSDTDRVDNASEQVAGTEPTNAASVLALNSPSVEFPNMVLSWPSVTGRTYAIRASATADAAYTNPVQTGIGETAPLNVATVDISGLAGSDFFRLTVERP